MSRFVFTLVVRSAKTICARSPSFQRWLDLEGDFPRQRESVLVFLFGGPGRGTRSRGGFVRVRCRGPQDQAHFDLQSPLPPSVLIYSTELQDSVLYILESENVEDTPVDLRDVLTGARPTLKLPTQHALALIVKQEKSVIAKYGF